MCHSAISATDSGPRNMTILPSPTGWLLTDLEDPAGSRGRAESRKSATSAERLPIFGDDCVVLPRWNIAEIHHGRKKETLM